MRLSIFPNGMVFVVYHVSSKSHDLIMSKYLGCEVFQDHKGPLIGCLWCKIAHLQQLFGSLK